MNAFASDLDRTLIFSKRILDSYGSSGGEESIERLDGKPISYISPKTKSILKQINEEMLFIPVTTRTIEQYKRIDLFREEIVPEYAITSNGGTILKGGVPLKEWSLYTHQLLKTCTPREEVMKKAANLDSGWIKKIKLGDHAFFYIILHPQYFSTERLIELGSLMDRYGWQLSLQDRKLYFIPKVLTKWVAVHYLCEVLGMDDIFTAGDSMLDYELIVNATHGIAPLHGEVVETYPSISHTAVAGIKASEEIVETVQSRYGNLHV